jgi:ankyrin repeat protein
LHYAAWATKLLQRDEPPEAEFAGTLETMKTLLLAGANPNVTDQYGTTPLHAAACRGNQAVVEYLVSHGADVNAVSQGKQDTWTPLSEAVGGRHLEIARFLRRKGATLDLASAAALGEEDYIRENLKNAGKETRYYSLVAACQSGEAHIVSILLEGGVPPHGFDPFNHTFSPLHHAARRNQQEVARLLIKHGADVNCRDDFGNSPLYEAVRHGHHQMVRLLVNNGANINQGDKHGETVLHYAAAPAEEDLEMLELLLKLGANPNATANGGSTPLRRAVNRTEIENVLRRFGAK